MTTAWLVLGGCSSLPQTPGKPITTALPAPHSGPLASASKRLASGRPEDHGSFLLLAANEDALHWRLALIDSASSSLDIQLYLWQSGAASQLLFDRILKAAQRGVRVRILVDDFLFQGDEKTLASVCRHHPNIDIRIFNPSSIRNSRLGAAVEFLCKFRRLNRRMHNKTWTADRLFTIVGGRNVHDHYYGLDDHYNFLDLDVLACGPMVNEVATGFDLFWNAAQSRSGAQLSRRGTAEDLEELKAQLATALTEHQNDKLRQFPVAPQDWSQELAGLPARMTTGRAQFLQDHPDPQKDDRRVVTSLQQMTSNQQGELILVSPYFIPSAGAIENIGKAVDSGITVGILTPSLAANNQPLAHSHYKKKRKPVIASGARLFELRADPPGRARELAETAPIRGRPISLHAKALVGDRSRCFIGSLNLDPRAMRINTESGLLIDSPELAGKLLEILRSIALSDDALEVVTDDKDRLQWRSSSGEMLAREPASSLGKRILSFIGGLLPIEGQL